MPMLLSNQGVMVTCRIHGPGTVESKSSHARATRETRNILFIISPLKREPSFSSTIKSQLKPAWLKVMPTAHSQLRKSGFLSMENHSESDLNQGWRTTVVFVSKMATNCGSDFGGKPTPYESAAKELMQSQAWNNPHQSIFK